MGKTSGKGWKKIVRLTVLAAALAMPLTACGGGKTTDTTQRAEKETERSGVEDMLAAMKGEETTDAMAGDNQAVIEIGTAEELAEFRDRVNAGEQALDAVLTADIDMSSVCGETAGSWVPIASEDGHMGGSYNGVFDGAGHVIRGLYMAGDDVDYAGLFLKIGYTGIVKDLGLEEVYIDSFNAAALTLENEGIIENCYSSGTVKGYDVSGLIGQTLKESKVTNCYSMTAVEGRNGASGVVRESYSAEISGCYNQGSVSVVDGESSSYAAGVVGSASGTVTDCYNVGAISGGNDGGGVAGGLREGAVMRDCYNTGSVTDIFRAAGVCGGVDESAMLRCYNEGTVEGKVLAAGVAIVSGETSQKSVVANCFNRGEVSSSSYAMGVAVATNSLLLNCYNQGTVASENQNMSGASGVGGGAVKGGDEAQMMYNCYGAGPLTEGSGGLLYWDDTELDSVFYQDDTALGYFFNRKSDDQDPTHGVSKEQLTDGTVLGQLNAYVDGFSGLPEDCVTVEGLTLDPWKAGADGYPVFEWESQEKKK